MHSPPLATQHSHVGTTLLVVSMDSWIVPCCYSDCLPSSNKFSADVKFTITLIRLLFTFSIPCLLTLAIYLSLACELARVNKEEVFDLMKNKPTIIKHRKVDEFYRRHSLSFNLICLLHHY